MSTVGEILCNEQKISPSIMESQPSEVILMFFVVVAAFAVLCLFMVWLNG
jgi:hypothetical protein